MSQNEQGMLYPFRLSGSRMRQSAQQLRRQGQVLDALTLVRRAAEQEDTPAAWLALAVELRSLGNWEVSAQLLARVLSREPEHPTAWMEMARCLQALGQNEAAVDCAYHQLHCDPWSAEGDAARSLLAELETIPEASEPRRTQRLIHRGLTAWQSGERSLGERRIRRAIRLAADKERLLVTTSMMCMLEMDFQGALHYLPMALRLNPDDPRTLTALSTLYQQLGKRRIALGFLQRAGKNADSVMAEDGFLTAAWAQDAWPEMEAYLGTHLKRQPWRIPLLSAKATMRCDQEDMDAAQQLWKEIRTIDPDDRHAGTMLAVSQSGTERLINAPGMLPRSERQQQMTELKMAAESLPMTGILRPGSRERQLLDWFIGSSDASECQYAMSLLESSEESAVVIPYLKELLCRPFLRMETRQWALIRLAEMGCRDQMLIMAGNHFNVISCQSTGEITPKQSWRIFLTALLAETRGYQQSREIAEFAAAVWRCLPQSCRMDAAHNARYVWVKAMEILYLRMAGEEEYAVKVAEDCPLSARKISRVLRRIGRCMAAEPLTE